MSKRNAPAPSAQVYSWDYKGQPDMAAIAACVEEMSAAGPVCMVEVQTGDDNYAWAISSSRMTPMQAYRLYVGEG